MNLYVLLIVTAVFTFTPASGALHPILLDPVIQRCKNLAPMTCNTEVWYDSGGVGVTEVTPRVPPNPTGGLDLIALGVHCDTGSELLGIPFSSCYYDDSPKHAPTLGQCRLASSSAWDLDPAIPCTISHTWGSHTGAGPGGECVLFVQKGQWSAQSALTIYGVLNPTAVANAGNLFCQKPLPPSVNCDVNLPAEIDHRTIGTTGISTVTVSGSVECGMSPKVVVVGGGDLNLAPGLTAHVTAQIDRTDTVNLTSTLTAVRAPAGVHSGAVVVLVSPY